MGNEIPRQPYMGHSDRPADPILAKIIKEHEQAIARRNHEIARIKKDTLTRRVIKLGRVWSLSHYNKSDYAIIDAAMDMAGDNFVEYDEPGQDIEDASAKPAARLDEPFDRYKKD